MVFFVAGMKRGSLPCLPPVTPRCAPAQVDGFEVVFLDDPFEVVSPIKRLGSL